jgi:hypothetical protein
MHQTICACESTTCPADGGGFFVTVRDAGRTGFILGPYPTHEEAIANVERGRRMAEQANARAVFYAFGTARVTASRLPASVFGL